MARMGRLGRLLRRRPRRCYQRPAGASPARLRSETAHVRPGIRGRAESRDGLSRRALVLSDGRAGRCVPAAQLRRKVSRSAADPPGPGWIRERAGCGARVRTRRREADSILSKCGALDLRQDRFLLRPGHHSRQRRGPSRGADCSLRHVCARRIADPSDRRAPDRRGRWMAACRAHRLH